MGIASSARTIVAVMPVAVLIGACAAAPVVSPSRSTASAPPREVQSPAPHPASATATKLAVSVEPAEMDARYREALPLFEYDETAPLELAIEPLGEQLGVVRHELAYASPAGGSATGALLSPAGEGTYPGLIMLHGAGGDRRDLIDEGRRYTALGVHVLLLDAPSARRATGDWVQFSEADRREQIQLVLDLRRAVDVLAEVGADPERIGFVGYSYGGAMGAGLAGVEHRIRAYALAVADGGLVEHFTGPDDTDGEVSRLPADARAEWIEAMEPIEPLYFVRHAAPSALLFQSARKDELIPVEDAERLHRHASEPKTIAWYDSGHELPIRAWCDQVDWLRDHLAFADAAWVPACSNG